MQYDLVFYPNKDEKIFETIKGFENDSTLKGIIEFCHKFENYNDLVNDLYQTGFIYHPTLNGIFKIHSRTSKESKPKVFAKGITYKPEAKFFDISYLQNYYANNVNDPDFMKPIIETYFNYILTKSEKAKEHLYYIRFALNSKENYGDILQEKDEVTIESAMRNFVKTFCERKNSKQKWVTNYSNLTLLARIAIAHERQLLGFDPNEPIDDNLNIETEIQTMKNLISHYYSLINEGNITTEEMTIYEQKIEELKAELEELKTRNTGR